MKPTVGRIVHFIDPRNDDHLAAIITWIPDYPGIEQAVNLAVFNRDGSQFTRVGISYFAPSVNIQCPSNTWHWPEREEMI